MLSGQAQLARHLAIGSLMGGVVAVQCCAQGGKKRSGQ
jgi:hypothetical protein